MYGNYKALPEWVNNILRGNYVMVGTAIRPMVFDDENEDTRHLIENRIKDGLFRTHSETLVELGDMVLEKKGDTVILSGEEPDKGVVSWVDRGMARDLLNQIGPVGSRVPYAVMDLESDEVGGVNK